MLSVKDKAIVAVENFYNNKNLYVTITRKIFNRICKDYLLLCMKPIHDALETCELEPDDIDEIILVGGATRMPCIQDNIRLFFKGNIPYCSVNPDEVVAVGAGIQAYIINNHEDPFAESVVLLDVIPLSLGVETIGGVMDVIVPRNTTIPTTRKKLYTSDSDFENTVTIKVYEGERKMTKDNFFVGQFDLTGIDDTVPRGFAEIQISFSIDMNGIINITAVDKKNGENKKSIRVNGNKGRLTKERINQLINEAHEMEMYDKLEREKKNCYYEIEDLCSNVLINLKNDEFKLKDEDKTYIRGDINKILDWLHKQSYHKREKKEYHRILKKLNKTYGTLMLKCTRDNNKVSGVHVKNKNNTSIFDSDNEDETIYEKLNEDELGLEDNVTEEKKKQIKNTRTYLCDLCYSIIDVLNHSNIKKKDKTILKDMIDDTLLWVHVGEKIKLVEYTEKIDSLNSMCDKIVEKYGDDIFDNFINKKTKTLKEELEYLCYAILTSINNNMFIVENKYIKTLEEKVSSALDWIIQLQVKKRKSELKEKDFIVDDDLYQKKINDINDYCDILYNKMNSINIPRFSDSVVLVQNNTQYDDGISLEDLKNMEGSVKDDSGDNETLFYAHIKKLYDLINELYEWTIINKQQSYTIFKNYKFNKSEFINKINQINQECGLCLHFNGDCELENVYNINKKINDIFVMYILEVRGKKKYHVPDKIKGEIDELYRMIMDIHV